MLVEGEFTVESMTLENSEGQWLPTLPMRLNPGETIALEYGWPPLVAGRHTVTFTLIHKNVYGRQSVLKPPESLTLTLDLTIVLDRDGDGVPDDRDACPDTLGLPEFGGCPDTDGDGVPDKDDCCPSTRGTVRGCPDRDDDGFPDEVGTCDDLTIDGCPDDPCGVNGGCFECRKEYDYNCPYEDCKTDPVSGDQVCETKYHEKCNEREVCECPTE